MGLGKAGMLIPNSKDERAREGIALPRCHEASSNRVAEDVVDRDRKLLISAKEVIPEARLPEGPLRTQAPGCPLSEILELTDKGHDVASHRGTENQMDVIWHDAESIDGHACFYGVDFECFNRRCGNTGIGKDRCARSGPDCH